jgi:hypothetical protein
MERKQFAEERVRIGKVVQRSKFGQKIVDTVINPILDAVEKDMADTADWIGAFIVDHLRQNILASSPAGRTYEVILVADGGGKGAYTSLGEYTASAPGQPPASFDSGLGVPTGTLFESIGFEIDGTGRVRVGIFNSTGEEYTSLFYRGGKIFVTEGDDGSKTPVEVYANALDTGASGGDDWSVSPRPWFRDVMEEIRPIIRKVIRERLHAALQGRSKVAADKKIMYFRVNFDNKKSLSAVNNAKPTGYNAAWRGDI